MIGSQRLIPAACLSGLAVCLMSASAFAQMGGGGGGMGGGGGGMGGGGGGMGGGGNKVMLGKMLYFDENLSNPAGQSCASCHHPSAGFADPDSHLPVSEGVIAGRFGGRNSPTAAYQAYAPDAGYDEEGDFFGGQFWDGRALDLIEQAKGPFLNPVEMNNPNPAAVVSKVAGAHYANMMRKVYGNGVFNNTNYAYQCIADAIAEFEKSPHMNQFSSRYDRYLAGDNSALTNKEKKGLKLFEGKAGCAACHPSRPAEDGTPPVFTDFTYDNLGIPRNPANPFYYMTEWNPAGPGWIDYGLMWTTANLLDAGKMKVPTLRNIAKTAPYGHNGYFQTLTEIVEFYNTRDVSKSYWPAPEVAANVNKDELGNLKLSRNQIDDIVAFLHTLSDEGCGCGGDCGCGGMGGTM